MTFHKNCFIKDSVQLTTRNQTTKKKKRRTGRPAGQTTQGAKHVQSRLAPRHDRGVGNRQTERTAKQCGHGEPVGEPTHHRSLGCGPHIPSPTMIGLGHAGDDVDRGGEDQQRRGTSLRDGELALTLGVDAQCNHAETLPRCTIASVDPCGIAYGQPTVTA